MCGQEVIIVADHSKFGRLSLSKLCGLDEINTLVCDAALPDSYRGILEASGVAVHLAPAESEHRNGNGAARGPAMRAETP